MKRRRRVRHATWMSGDLVVLGAFAGLVAIVPPFRDTALEAFGTAIAATFIVLWAFAAAAWIINRPDPAELAELRR